ncbi:MAG TPA: DUF547 domain-containing protein [Candidatus Binatia bacterium]
MSGAARRVRVGAALALASVTALGALCGGCTAIRPTVPGVPPPSAPPFSHALLDRVLARHVDDRGLVDYAALAREPDDLERYYALLAAVSPDSHPDLFPTRDDRLAYWINAYNAAVLVTVLRHYPIPSVTALRTPFPLSLASDKIGFFLLQRITLGGETTSLYALENSLIRPRFREPRVHFALNCASLGCPRLPRRAFAADELERQLDDETRRFFAEERNLRIDHAARVVSLSSLLDWYDGDFTGWLEERYPGKDATLLDYVALYVTPERRAELERARGYEIRFVPYDWGLNDQARADASAGTAPTSPSR